MKTPRLFALLAILAVVSQPDAAVSEEHPTVLELGFLEWSPWTAVAEVLDTTRGVVYSQVPDTLRAKLEREAAVFDQRFGSARDHGLEEGESAPDYCGPYHSASEGITWAPIETRDVHLALMLADVAVAATTSEVIPGFDAEGNPYVLLALSEVEPLFSDSPLPVYALVAVESLVIGDRVYCGIMPFPNTTPYQPRALGRVALAGFMEPSSPVIVLDPVSDGFFAALEQQDHGGFGLNWKFHARKKGPARMADLRALADELVSRGLRDLTTDLRTPQEDEDWDKRIDFTDAWNEATEGACGVLGAERLDNGIQVRIQPCPE